MQVFLETTSTIGRKLTITIPADKIAAEMDKRLKDLSRRVRLDGFRPGKVPVKVVKRRYGEGVKQDALSELMQSAFFEAVVEQKVNPAGSPTIETVSDNDEGFTFVAAFDVYPEIVLNDFTGISIERPVAEVSETDIDEMVETLRKQSTTFEVVERAAENSDRVLFDYVGMKDGVAFEGGSATNATLELGSGRMIPGFEDGLVGVSAGEEKALELTFPEAYHNAELAGQTVVFNCTVHSVSVPVLPELNDEFFARFGVTEGGLEGFRTEVARNMDRELRQAVKNKVKNQVMDGLMSMHEVEVPRGLIVQEIDRLREQAVQQFGGVRGGFDPRQLPAELFEADAKKRVALGLLVGEVVKQLEIKVDEDRVRAMIEDIASAYQTPQEVIDWYNSSEENLSQIRYVVLEEQVVDTILAAAKVSDVNCNYQDAIKPVERAEEAEEAEEETVA